MALQRQEKSQHMIPCATPYRRRRLDREVLELRLSRKTREDLLADLAEIDFQLDFGSTEEAKREIENALEIWPKHPLLQTRLRRAMASLQEPEAGETPKCQDEETEFDTAYFEIKGLSEGTRHTSFPEADLQSTDEHLGSLCRRIEEKIDVDDCDRHYNLGIAYKEMMLIEPAMEAFKLALRDPAKTLDCCSVLAICEEGLGNLPAAIAWLRQGIAAPGFSVEESLGLQYHLGVLLLEIGDTDQAHRHLRTVGEMDAALRQQKTQIGA
ncbi:MAG: hypothetical protein Q8O00_13425 [Holophaga sp.]|nr:hypothetical protein [Holophaga sp.]